VPFRGIHSEHFLQQEQKKKKRKQIPQLSEDYPDIVPSTTQQGIDFVPDAALEPVSPSLPSSFMWPMTGSTALRRRSSFLIVGVTPLR